MSSVWTRWIRTGTVTQTTPAARQALDVLVAPQLEQCVSAYAAEDWPAADGVRDRLAAAGIEVTDEP